jgi:hypothetical protein
MGECWTPGYTVWTSRLVQDPHMYGPDPLNGIRAPSYGVRTAHSGVPRPYLRPRRGSGADTCPGLLWCAPDLSAYTPAPRSGRAPMLPCGILRAA